MKTNILFMGTPEFSVPILKGLVEANYHIVGVVSQPDRPVGRKKTLTPPPVKIYAQSVGLDVYQPQNIKEEFQNILELEPDLIITAAYGQIIPSEIIQYPKHKCVNVHGSLLPSLRGGAPIHHAIKNGDTKTGITIMYMEQKMDSGDILVQREIPILDEDTVGTMFQKLSILGRDLLLDSLDDIIAGNIQPIPQDESKITFGYNIKRSDELLDFNQNARSVFNHIRAFDPWPGTYAFLFDEPFKIWMAKEVFGFKSGKVGEIVSVSKKSFVVACKDDTFLEILEVQPKGKKRMKTSDYLNGIGKQIIQEGVIFS